MSRLATELGLAKKHRRTLSLRLKSLLIRQAARRMFDLPGFGKGPVERMLSALVLSAAFFMIFLVLSIAGKLPPEIGIGIATVVSAVAMFASGALVMVGTDEQITQGIPWTRAHLLDARSAVQRLQEDVDEENEAAEDDESRRRIARKRRLVLCPFCRDEIRADSLKCRHCGEILDPALREKREQLRSPAAAAILSLVLPGLGQIYNGSSGSGILWLFATIIGYVCCIIPGVLLHIICIFDAASSG